MSAYEINDIQEEVVRSLQKDIIKKDNELKEKDVEISELRSFMLLLLHLLGDSVTIVQRDYEDFIGKILRGQVGLQILPSAKDPDIVTLNAVEVGDKNVN